MALVTTKSVSFNVENPEDEQSLTWSNSKPSFSGYVKELIKQDRKKNNPVKSNGAITVQATGKTYKPPLLNK